MLLLASCLMVHVSCLICSFNFQFPFRGPTNGICRCLYVWNSKQRDFTLYCIVYGGMMNTNNPFSVLGVSGSTTGTTTGGGGGSGSGTDGGGMTATMSSPTRSSSNSNNTNNANSARFIDPEMLLDMLNQQRLSARKKSTTTTNNTDISDDKKDTETTNTNNSNFDPIEFLNQHYTNEQVLIESLPTLRSSVNNRISILNDRIANCIQKQSDTASTIRNSIIETKSSCTLLQSRIYQVQQTASNSEKAVVQITSTMKQLDYCKKHLNITIITLKRLHMLINAVEQLRTINSIAIVHPYQLQQYIIQIQQQSQSQSQQSNSKSSTSSSSSSTSSIIQYPDYKNGSYLLDAIKQLLEYFTPYIDKVQPMQLICTKIQLYKTNLHSSIIFNFRILYFGYTKTIQLLEKESYNKNNKNNNTQQNQLQQQRTSITDNNNNNDNIETIVANKLSMSTNVLQGCVLFIDSLGENIRKQFIHNFCQDILGDYLQQFEPVSSTTTKHHKKGNSLNNIESSSASNSSSSSQQQQQQPSSQQLQEPEKRISSFKKVVPVVEAVPIQSSSTVVSTQNDTTTTSTGSNTIKKTTETSNELSSVITGLDNLDKSYAWFLNGPLKSIQAKFSLIFPINWYVQSTLVTMFLQLTRDRILALLDGPRRDPDASNASILLKALQKTISFEKDITGWLERECKVVFAATVPASTTTSTADPNQGDNTKSSTPLPTTVKPLIGMASIAFQKYMTPYIRLEEQKMEEQLAQALEDRAVDTRGEHPVFISSTNLFVYIKGSITRCTVLTKGYALFLLYRLFRRSLKNYVQILNTKLQQPQPTSSGVTAIPGISFGKQQNDKNQNNTMNASYILPIGEEVTTCHVISTCEYCTETMEALEDLIRDTIDNEYKTKIDMMSDQEQFHDTAAKCIRILVSGLTNRLDNALKDMSHINWSIFDTVGEESSYVFMIHEQIEPFIKTIKQLLPTSYFRSFCDKFVVAFTTSYFDFLTRQKKISEQGTQQILLDLYNLKILFLKLPVLEDTSSVIGGGGINKKPSVSTGAASIAPAMYTKMVQKQFNRIEITLKLVGTPINMLIDNFKNQWPTGTSNDLTTIMTLRGMKRTEQASMLEKLGYDPIQAMKGATANITSATIVSEHVQALQDQGSNVAAKVNSDFNSMRQKFSTIINKQ